MTVFPHLSELGSSAVLVLLVLGLGVLLPEGASREKGWQRLIILSVAAGLALRYVIWRGTETLAPAEWSLDMAASWSLFALEALTVLGTLSSFVILTRYRDRSAEADAHACWWGKTEPRVAVLIATYNEELDVLERTILGALFLRHENKEVLVLDDGRRDWLRDFCAERGVTYLRRPDNRDSKAGNINHAIGVLAARDTPPDFVAVLDADFVAHRGFISRSLALFKDPEIGLVQTPQHFFNADPIQHNLGISRSYPDEQRLFFDVLQPSRDGWDIAFCCGTSSMVRWEAVQAIGGVPTESVTEDYLLTLALQEAGWHTAYLNEALTEGLAPEGLREYVTQRSRWCLGLMQIARSRFGPFGDAKLRLRDRWSVIDALLYWTTTYPFRLAALIYPLLYWFFNITVVDASLPDVVSYFGCYYVWTMVAVNFLSRDKIVPIVGDTSQLVAALPICRAVVTGLLRPRGHPFSVTAKGGDRSRIVVQWSLLAPFALLLALTLLGLTIGIASDRFSFTDAGDGKWVILFWSIYNLFVLIVTITACVELPRRERHVADRPERTQLVVDGVAQSVWIASLTRDTVRLRGEPFPAQTSGRLRIAGVGDVETRVIRTLRDGARLQLLPTPEQREALILRFYTDDSVPGIASVRRTAMLADLASRFTFRARRE